MGDVLAEGLFKALTWQGPLVAPSTADGHIVDHSTAYVPGQRFPNLPDSYWRTRSVTRRQHEFGINDGMQERMFATARRPEPRDEHARIGITRCSSNALKLVPLADG
jgi:hypothetical protein